MNEKKIPYILGLIAIGMIYSFNLVAVNCSMVFIYWLIFTYFIFSEIHKIRKKIREQYINSIFKNTSYLYKLLRKSLFMNFVSLALSLPLSTSLVVFVFLSDIQTIILILFDAIIFCHIYLKLRDSLDNVLIEQVRYIFTTWIAISINVIIMTFLYYLMVFFTIELFPVMSEQIPEYVVEKVKHSCRLLQIIGRLLADFEMEIHSLRTIDTLNSQINSYLIIFTYTMTVSAIPFVAISFIMKSFIDFQPKTQQIIKESSCDR